MSSLRQRALAGAVTACLGLGCGPSRVAWQPRVDPGEGALAVLASTDPVRTRPDVRAPLVPMGADAPALAGFGETLYSFRVRRSRGGWAELETLGPDALTCAPSPAALSPFRLLLYARESSLRPVTRMEVERRFRDGTHAFLARGAPVERVRGTTHRVRFGDLILSVELRPAAIGTRFLPSRFETPPAVGRLDPRALAAASLGLGGSRVDAVPGADVAVQSISGEGEQRRVAVRSACGVLELDAPASAVEPLPAFLVGAAQPTVWVRAGAAIRWPDGRRAGEVRRTTPLGAPREPAGCHAVAGWDALTLCFDPTDLSRTAPPERGIAGALASPIGGREAREAR